MPIKRSVFKSFDTIILEHSSGSKAEVALYGAHVLSWKSQTGKDLLMLSRQSSFENGKPIRGGIPVVFPQFSDEGTLPKHGFVRTALWNVENVGEDKNGNVFLLLTFKADQNTKALWQYDFHLKYLITLGSTLTLNFSIHNDSNKAFKFQMAFHTYFSVPTIEEVKVRGLKGFYFADYLTDHKEFKEEQNELTINKETDRVYKQVMNDIELIRSSANDKILIKKENMPDVVVWNPWKEKAHKLPDFADDEYLSMICIETGAIYKPYELSAGTKWEGKTEYVIAS